MGTLVCHVSQILRVLPTEVVYQRSVKLINYISSWEVFMKNIDRNSRVVEERGLGMTQIWYFLLCFTRIDQLSERSKVTSTVLWYTDYGLSMD